MSKFNNELAERLYEVSLDSGQDDTIGSVDELGWYARFNDERTILYADSQGFVTALTYEDRPSFEQAWGGIVVEYAAFDGEGSR